MVVNFRAVKSRILDNCGTLRLHKWLVSQCLGGFRGDLCPQWNVTIPTKFILLTVDKQQNVMVTICGFCLLLNYNQLKTTVPSKHLIKYQFGNRLSTPPSIKCLPCGIITKDFGQVHCCFHAQGSWYCECGSTVPTWLQKQHELKLFIHVVAH